MTERAALAMDEMLARLVVAERVLEHGVNATVQMDEEPGLREYVCDGCCNLATDFALVVLIDEPGRYLAEQRCRACRDRLAFVPREPHAA
jgi:hypothetical protein